MADWKELVEKIQKQVDDAGKLWTPAAAGLAAAAPAPVFTQQGMIAASTWSGPCVGLSVAEVEQLIDALTASEQRCQRLEAALRDACDGAHEIALCCDRAVQPSEPPALEPTASAIAHPGERHGYRVMEPPAAKCGAWIESLQLDCDAFAGHHGDHIIVEPPPEPSRERAIEAYEQAVDALNNCCPDGISKSAVSMAVRTIIAAARGGR